MPWRMSSGFPDGDDTYISMVKKDIEQHKLLEDKVKECEYRLEQNHGARYYQDALNVAKKELAEYRPFGYTGIDYGDHPYLQAKHTELDKMFTLKYGRHRLGYSSPVVFDLQLQLTFYEIADHYEHRFQMYYMYEKLMREEMHDKKHAFSTKSVSTTKAKVDASNKQRALPDIVDDSPPVYIAQSKDDNTTTGDGTSWEDSLSTRLSEMVAGLAYDKYLKRDYLNEFAHLFQTILR